jgi:hypothetical protein
LSFGPYVSAPDADQGSNCNYYKGIGHSIPHIRFSLGDFARIGRPSLW